MVAGRNARGKSEHRRAGCRVIPGKGDFKESAKMCIRDSQPDAEGSKVLGTVPFSWGEDSLLFCGPGQAVLLLFWLSSGR